MVAFADDDGLIITGKDLEEIRRIVELSDHKTEAVLFTSRKKVKTITLDAGHGTIISQPNVRYLGVMLDTRLKFKYHV